MEESEYLFLNGVEAVVWSGSRVRNSVDVIIMMVEGERNL